MKAGSGQWPLLSVFIKIPVEDGIKQYLNEANKRLLLKEFGFLLIALNMDFYRLLILGNFFKQNSFFQYMFYCCCYLVLQFCNFVPLSNLEIILLLLYSITSIKRSP